MQKRHDPLEGFLETRTRAQGAYAQLQGRQN